MTVLYKKAFVLILCLLVFDCKSDISRTKVVYMARLLCTGQDICSVNNSQTDTFQSASVCCSALLIPRKASEAKYDPECSCEPNCKEHEDCCFPDQEYPLGNVAVEDEKGAKFESENDTTIVYECLYPLSRQPSDSIEKIKSQSFWMVSEIVDNRQLPRNQKCGDFEVESWGSLLPVSSKKTGNIYKNIFCAREHNVTDEDIVAWKGAYHCTSGPRRYFDLSEAYLDTCQKKFFTPKDIAIKKTSLCYNSLIDTCSKSTFPVPMTLNRSQSEIIDACTSGFISPYRQKDMFANIFCHICNGNVVIPDVECYNPLSDTGRSSGYITGLFDYNYLQSLSRKQDVRNDPPKVEMACLAQDSDFETVGDKCKLIRCPFGQIRNREGTCIFRTLKWSNIIFQISAQLKSAKPFNIHQYLSDVGSAHGPFDISNLMSPLSHSFKINYVHYKTLNSPNDTDELVIFMSALKSASNMKMLINRVKKSTNKKWLLKSHNTTLSLNPKLPSEMITFREMVTTSKNTSYKRIYMKYNLGGGYVFLTKLYFCEIVQLESNEFIFSNIKNIVFNKISNRSLYSHEYSLHSSGASRVSFVCLDNSGYNRIDKNNSIKNALSFEALIPTIFFLITFMKTEGASLMEWLMSLVLIGLPHLSRGSSPVGILDQTRLCNLRGATEERDCV